MTPVISDSTRTLYDATRRPTLLLKSSIIATYTVNNVARTLSFTVIDIRECLILYVNFRRVKIIRLEPASERRELKLARTEVTRSAD
jgi:hypothetical protein